MTLMLTMPVEVTPVLQQQRVRIVVRRRLAQSVAPARLQRAHRRQVASLHLKLQQFHMGSMIIKGLICSRIKVKVYLSLQRAYCRQVASLNFEVQHLHVEVQLPQKFCAAPPARARP